MLHCWCESQLRLGLSKMYSLSIRTDSIPLFMRRRGMRLAIMHCPLWFCRRALKLQRLTTHVSFSRPILRTFWLLLSKSIAYPYLWLICSSVCAAIPHKVVQVCIYRSISTLFVREMCRQSFWPTLIHWIQWWREWLKRIQWRMQLASECSQLK